jgi:hypothetical protein
MQCNRKQSCLFALSLSLLFSSISFAQSRQTPAQRWEHKIVYNASETDLNKLGDEGWELVATTLNGSSVYYALKRLKPVTAPRFVDPSERPAPTTSAPTCSIAPAQTPAIRGLRLGMTLDEVLTLFPGANPNTIKGEVESAIAEPKFGVAVIRLNTTQHKERDRDGALYFDVTLFDRQVVGIGTWYGRNNFTEYGTIFTLDQFLDKLIAAYNLPPKENWTTDKNNPNQVILKCKEVEFQIDVQGVRFNIIAPAYLEKQKQRMTEALVRKRTEFKP